MKNKLIGLLYHDKYSMTLERVSIMLDSERVNLVKKQTIPLPKSMTANAYNDIMSQIAIMMNKKELDGQVNEQLMKVGMYNKITNLLPSLYYGLYINQVPPPEMILYYEKQYGHIPTCKADLNIILQDIERLTEKYNELFPEKQVSKPKESKLKFEKLILGIEMTLELSIDRKSKLYQLETYFNSAVEKIEQQKKLMAKYQH